MANAETENGTAKDWSYEPLEAAQWMMCAIQQEMDMRQKAVIMMRTIIIMISDTSLCIL